MTEYGTWCVFLLFVCSVIRVLLPLDMKHAVVIESDRLYPWLLEQWNHPLLAGGCSLGTFLLLCWGVGSVALFIKDICEYVLELRTIKRFVLMEDEQVTRISKEKFVGNAEIFVSPNVVAPKVTGVLKPYIYLPPMDVADDELRSILKHEIYHIRGGDIIIKVFYNVIKDIFWWNPLMHFF